MNPFKRKVKIRTPWSYCEGGEIGKALHYMRPGEPGRMHVVTHIHSSLKLGGTQLLTVLDEGNPIGRFYVHGARDLVCRFEISVGKAVTVYQNIENHPDNVAALTISGYTEDL